MSDLLSSASLLLTIITVLYGLWSPEIKRSLDQPTPAFKAQCMKPLADIRLAIRWRALPLVLAALSVAAVFAKDALSLCARSWQSYRARGAGLTLERYDAVGTAFVLIVILSIALTAHLTGDLVQLFRKRRELNTIDG
jgi:hypothetical protein